MVDINRYIDIETRLAIYGEEGNYVDPIILITVIANELNMSYSEIVENIIGAKLNLEEKTIQIYLKKLQQLEEPKLYEEYEKVKPLIKNLLEWQDETDIRLKKAIELEHKINEYTYDAYTYTYYKRMITILKNKCNKFLRLMNSITNISIMDDELISYCDITIKDNKILYTDIFRIAEPFIYNFKNLKRCVESGNKLETYLTEKKSADLHSCQKEGNLECHLYPNEEIQIHNIDYANVLGLIPLTVKQQNYFMQQKVNDLCNWIEDDEELSLKKDNV